MKLDPWKHEEKYLKWKEKIKETGFIKGISKENSGIILDYLFDMEIGRNVATVSMKGARSYLRLNTLKQGMIFLTKKFEKLYEIKSLYSLTEDHVIEFFAKVRNGGIRKKDGGIYKSAHDMINIFKAFWHWHMKVNSKKGIKISDITEDLDTSNEKPKWVYLNEDEVKRMVENSNFKYKVLIMFLFDAGIRAPTELMNIKVSDFYNDFKELNIREETAKKGSFGRKIKLMLSSDFVKKFIKENEFELDDFVFQISPAVVNRYLKRLATKLFGEGKTLAGQKYNEISMYDFRHISCCYWLPRYKSESALKFRFGWKKSDKIHYYSELLGMRDTISEEDMLLDIGKIELEKELMRAQNDKKILQERVEVLEKQMAVIARYVEKGIVIVEKK